MLQIDYKDRYNCFLNGVRGQVAHSTREVFIFDDVVIKLDKIDQKKVELQNERELANYNLIDDYDYKFFAKLLEFGHIDDGRLFLVQERIKLSEVAPLTEKYKAIFYRIAEKYNLYDVLLSYDAYEDGNHCNMYSVKNGFKIYDIGCESNFKFSKFSPEVCTHSLFQSGLPF